MDEAPILGLSAFGFVGCVAYFLLQLFSGKNDEQKLRTRLQNQDAPSPSDGTAKAAGTGAFIWRLGQVAARPFMPTKREKISSARKHLAAAGIYSPSAIKALYGFK